MMSTTNSNQVSIDDFLIPYGKKLDLNNRWIKLAKLIPWDVLAKIYNKNMSTNMGRKGLNPRIAIGSIIIKHMKGLSDEDTIVEIQENPYLQYFLGLAEFTHKPVFTAPLFVSIRKRLGDKEFGLMLEELLKKTEDFLKGEEETIKGDDETNTANKGHLIVDATVAPADIKYPTDLDLLNEAREKSEQLIDSLYVREKGKKKPRTYRKKARKEYLSVAKIRKKNKKVIRKSVGKQIRYLRRNFKTIEEMLDQKGTTGFSLSNKEQRMHWIIREVYRQQNEMYENHTHSTPDRIVSISQPHVRPIVRGKSGKEVEFGAKISLSLVNGMSYIHRIDWDAFNESLDLKDQIENYKKQFGFYPETVSADQIYGNRENRAYMKERHIEYSGVKLGRPKGLTAELELELKALKDKRKERVKIEGKFGEGKRKYQLDLVKTKRSDTSESWIGAVFFVMNIAHLLRVIFLSLMEHGDYLVNFLKELSYNGISENNLQYFRLGIVTF
jgi:hypothetical protein